MRFVQFLFFKHALALQPAFSSPFSIIHIHFSFSLFSTLFRFCFTDRYYTDRLTFRNIIVNHIPHIFTLFSDDYFPLFYSFSPSVLRTVFLVYDGAKIPLSG